MCGIAGVFGGQGAHGDLCMGLWESLKHRGPDDHGWLLERGELLRGRLPAPAVAAKVLLFHTRLAILDLSPGGWQPMASPCGRYHLVFNGEIYNFVELRAELMELGHRFVTRSDSEVLLAGWQAWGVALWPRLLGMFALAIYDRQVGRLILARDGFGIKPLYYAAWRGGLAFASEIPPLLGLAGLERRVDPQAAYDYLLFGISDHLPGRTLVQGVRQLPAGHWLEVGLEDPLAGEPRCYWRPEPVERPIDRTEAMERVRSLFIYHTALHLRSDVPVAAAVSGGLDSSSLAAVMRLQLGEEATLATFSYIADHPRWNEEAWIDLVNAKVVAEPHKVRPVAWQMAGDLDRFLRQQGEPVSSTSMFAQYRVYQAAREAGFKVVLDGQGADELMAGYDYLLGARLTSMLRAGEWAGALALAWRAWRRPGVGRRLPLYLGEFLLPPAWQGLPRRLAGQPLTPGWLQAEWFAARQVQRLTPRRVTQPAVLREQLHQAVWRTSLPKLLRYQDRNSMAHGVESRVPFLTPAFAEFLLSLPEEYLVGQDGQGKSIFREAMDGIAPTGILERRDKIGFETPERDWLLAARPWVEGVLQQPMPPLLHGGKVAELWQRVRQGREQAARPLWRALNLVKWAEQWQIDV